MIYFLHACISSHPSIPSRTSHCQFVGMGLKRATFVTSVTAVLACTAGGVSILTGIGAAVAVATLAMYGWSKLAQAQVEVRNISRDVTSQGTGTGPGGRFRS